LKDTPGYIKIDGEQIDNLGLHVLRKGLCIIPQDSFVFSGTLKFNVDPYNEFNDKLIYETLEKYRIFESLKNASDVEVRVFTNEFNFSE
jgi:ATP-binding cassette subfamily C (CFTR/MRP) protein 4